MMSFGSFHPCSQEAQDPGDGTCPASPTPTPGSTSRSCKLSVFVPGPSVRTVAPPAVLHQVSLTVLPVHSLCLCLSLTSTTYTLTGYSFVKRRPRPSITVPHTLASGLFSKSWFPARRPANTTPTVPRDPVSRWRYQGLDTEDVRFLALTAFDLPSWCPRKLLLLMN